MTINSYFLKSILFFFFLLLFKYFRVKGTHGYFLSETPFICYLFILTTKVILFI